MNQIKWLTIHAHSGLQYQPVILTPVNSTTTGIYWFVTDGLGKDLSFTNVVPPCSYQEAPSPYKSGTRSNSSLLYFFGALPISITTCYFEKSKRIPDELVDKSYAGHWYQALQNQSHRPQMEVGSHQLKPPFHYSPCSAKKQQ